MMSYDDKAGGASCGYCGKALERAELAEAKVALLAEELKDTPVCENCSHWAKKRCGLTGRYALAHWSCGESLCKEDIKIIRSAGGFTPRILEGLDASATRLLERLRLLGEEHEAAQEFRADWYADGPLNKWVQKVEAVERNKEGK